MQDVLFENVEQFAARVGTSQHIVRAKIHRGELIAEKWGREYKIDVALSLEMIRARMLERVEHKSKGRDFLSDLKAEAKQKAKRGA